MYLRILTSLLFVLGGISFAHAAIGDLTVTPTRIVFEERDRSAQVYLVNRGEAPATYRIEFVQMRMDEDGQMHEIDAPNEFELFADGLIRYSPRQVELQPNEGQTVRLMLRKPADLPPGEYRSHLLFYALPDESVGMDIERQRGETEEGFSVAIQAVFRISIPVIVRHGSLPVEFTMSELSYQPGEPPTIELRVDREGQRSVYGDINVYFQPAAGGERILVKHLKDFVLYTSGNTRRLSTELEPPSDVPLRAGRLTAVYSETVDGRTEVLAERSISLP